MATITYGQLAGDGFSLSVEDFIIIHGIEYQVCRSVVTDKYYLENTAGDNGAIFHKFRLSGSRYELARAYEKDVEDNGCFPEFNQLDNLTKFVIWLIKTPLFKVGDKVKISKHKTGENYPFGFTEGMKEHSGDIATIAHIESGLKNHSYIFREFGFTWSENQLEFVSEAETVTCNTEEYIECLEVGDSVMVGGEECVVMCEAPRAYWISLRGELEQEIYDNLGITSEQKLALAKKYHATGLITASPEFENLEDLTDFVNALNSGEWKDIASSNKEEKPKKDITYGDLIDGYVLKQGDTLTLAGIPYQVHECPFLHTTNGDSYGEIFDVLGIKDKDAFCERFGELACKNCSFPEFKTHKALTKCVIELMERAEHIIDFELPESLAASMEYCLGSSTPIIVASELRPSSATDAGIVRLPEIKDDFRIIL